MSDDLAKILLTDTDAKAVIIDDFPKIIADKECRRLDGTEFSAHILLAPCKSGIRLCCLVQFVPLNSETQDQSGR